MTLGNIPESFLKKSDYDEIVLASDKDGAFAVIQDYNERFEWLLTSSYYYETEPDTTPPTKGLNVDYRPNSDQASLFPAFLGMWYSYPNSDIEQYKNFMVSVLKAAAQGTFTVLKDEKDTKYADTEGYNYVCKSYSGTTAIVWSTHMVCIDDVGYFIFFLTTESDYNNFLSKLYYDLIHATLFIKSNQTQVARKWQFKPGQFKLLQNYPNPFNASTNIEFTIDKAQNVSLEIFDQTGRLINVLFDKYLNSGHHTVNLNANNLASGCYHCVLKGEKQKDIKKILLIK